MPGPSGASSFVAAPVGFQPPGGRDPQDLVEFLRDYPGVRPSTVAAALTPGSGPQDPALMYWLTAWAHFRRRVGADLRIALEDALRVDPSGHAALNEAIRIISALLRTPLNEDP